MKPMEMRGEFLPKRSAKLTGGQNPTGKKMTQIKRKKEMLDKGKKEMGNKRRRGVADLVDLCTLI